MLIGTPFAPVIAYVLWCIGYNAIHLVAPQLGGMESTPRLILRAVIPMHLGQVCFVVGSLSTQIWFAVYSHSSYRILVVHPCV